MITSLSQASSSAHDMVCNRTERIEMSKVKVYVTGYCPYCTRAKQFLNSHDIEFESVDIGTDAEKRKWLVETTGMRTVPQIFVGDESVGGYTDMQKLHDEGGFFPLLDRESVSYTA